MSTKCSDCGESLTPEVRKCPRCGSTKRTHTVEISETIAASPSLGLRYRSGEKDQRGKPLREADTRVKGKG